jgi:hypothetical protein
MYFDQVTEISVIYLENLDFSQQLFICVLLSPTQLIHQTALTTLAGKQAR